MEIASSRLEGAPVLELSGEIDHGNSPVLSTAIEEALEGDQKVVMLDLSRVIYLDSGGVSVLLWAVRQLRDQGWVGVISPNANVKRLLEIVGLTVDAGFRLFADREEAGTAVKELSAQASAPD